MVSKVFDVQPLYPSGSEIPTHFDGRADFSNGFVETNHQLENRCFNSNVGIFEVLKGNQLQLTAFPAMQLSP